MQNNKKFDVNNIKSAEQLRLRSKDKKTNDIKVFPTLNIKLNSTAEKILISICTKL